MDEETQKKEMEEIKRNPCNYITNYMETLFPFTGAKIFRVLSLMPCSIIIDDLPYKSERIRTNINVLLLSFSGAAKSALARKFAEITYSPIEGRSYTAADLIDTINSSPIFSLIIEDYAQMSANEDINKIIESIIGDEKILDRHTMRLDIRQSVNGVALLCGIPDDLNDRLTSGTIFRTVCLTILHNDDEHSSIGEYIGAKIGIEDKESYLKEEIIKKYYELLQEIQAGENKDFEAVKGFIISEDIRSIIFRDWDKLTRFFRKNAPFNFFREEQEGYRFLVAYSFLNYFNREKKEGKIVITKEDCNFAVNLMKETMNTKYNILMSERLGRSIRSAKDFHTYMNNPKVPIMVKELIPIFLKAKFR